MDDPTGNIKPWMQFIHKNIVRHTAHTIVSWPNPKQWLTIDTYWHACMHTMSTHEFYLLTDITLIPKSWFHLPSVFREYAVSSSITLHCIISAHIPASLYPPHTNSTGTWWRHQMETFSTLLSLCAGNSPITGEFPSQRPVTRSFDVSLICALNKQSWGCWFQTPLRSLWRHCNELDPLFMLPPSWQWFNIMFHCFYNMFLVPGTRLRHMVNISAWQHWVKIRNIITTGILNANVFIDV